MNKRPMHPLKRYLFDNQISRAAFSTAAGVSVANLSRYLNYKADPRADTIARMITATGGALDFHDFLRPEEKAA